MPGQLFREGATVIVPDIGVDPVFVAVNVAIFPVPADPKPIAVLELVHVKVPPAGMLVKFVAATLLLLHNVMFEGTVTVGVGFTVIIYVEKAPLQLFTVGVTVIVAEIGEVPVLVALNEAILPVPLAAKPIAVFELVHENVPPAGVLVKLEAVTEPLLHTVISAGTVTLGEGFTVIEYEDGLP